MPLTPPRIGQVWSTEGGIYAGLVRGTDGGPDQHVILAATLPSELLDWAAAKKWAAALRESGYADWSLPSRDEAALLYTNVRDQVDPGWHWTGTQCSAGFAWGQYFDDGGQYYDDEKDEARARAVRRFAAESFSPSVQVPE